MNETEVKIYNSELGQISFELEKEHEFDIIYSYITVIF